MAALWEQTGAAQAAVRLVAFTAVRLNEARRARWDEFDFEAMVWTIPAERVKTGEAHRVPLSEQAARLVRGQTATARAHDAPHVFTSPRTAPEPISDTHMRAAVKKTGYETSIHGLRTAFRSWCQDTGVDREVADL